MAIQELTRGRNHHTFDPVNGYTFSKKMQLLLELVQLTKVAPFECQKRHRKSITSLSFQGIWLLLQEDEPYQMCYLCSEVVLLPMS